MMAQTTLLVVLLSQFEVVCVKAAEGRYTKKKCESNIFVYVRMDFFQDKPDTQ